jgi:hypothetical protein
MTAYLVMVSNTSIFERYREILRYLELYVLVATNRNSIVATIERNSDALSL